MYKPVILIGNGCRNNPNLVKQLCSQGVPILTTWMAMDLVPEDSPVYCGRPGMHGQRAANIILQKADVLLVYGARLDGESVAFDLAGLAPHAQKVVYDCDKAELARFPQDWQKTVCDLSDHELINLLIKDRCWLAWCRALYTEMRSEFDGSQTHRVYQYINYLSTTLPADEVIAPGSSGTFVQAFLQAYKVKAGQQIRNCSSIGAMGMDVPWAIGAALATGRHVTCFTGDGGFQMNFQELEVVRRLKLPITFCVICNNGYASIRNSQRARFGRVTGADPESGLTIIPIWDICKMFPEVDIRTVEFDPDFQVSPMVKSSMVDGKMRTDRLEDMTPKLPNLQELMAYGND